MNQAHTNTSFDIIIIGGGMVGLTLAGALKDSRLRIAVVEKKFPPELKPDDEFDLRVSAISHASQKVFEHIGAWQGMLNRRANPYMCMNVWDAEGSGNVIFNADETGVPELGHIIENRIVQLALLEKIRMLDNVAVFEGQAVTEFDYKKQASTITLEDGTELTCRLLVGADGANSSVRKIAGIDLDVADYQQKGIVAVVKPEQHHQHTAWQRFLPSGPLAFLPLANGYCSIVWSADNAESERILALDDEAFCKELGIAFEHRLGNILEAGQRAGFPLIRRHASQYIDEGLALIGDAAHTIHPLAGQGANLGFMDAASLGEIINNAVNQKRDFASLQTLRKYERWRRGENQLMMYSMSGFKNLFGNNNAVVSTIRNIGLSLVENSGVMKSVFVKRAMGFEGDLPEIARDHLV